MMIAFNYLAANTNRTLFMTNATDNNALRVIAQHFIGSFGGEKALETIAEWLKVRSHLARNSFGCAAAGRTIFHLQRALGEAARRRGWWQTRHVDVLSKVCI